MTGLLQLHEEYKQKRVPVLIDGPVSLDDIAQSHESLQSYCQQINESTQPMAQYLKQAIGILHKQEKGTSLSLAFADTMHYLLAQHNYIPVKSQTTLKGTFDFYSRNDTVVSVSIDNCQLYFAKLKSESRLDEFIQDFRYLKEGRNKELEDQLWIQNFPLMKLMVGAMGGTVGSIAGLLALGYFPLDNEAREFAGLVGISLGFCAGMYGALSAYKNISRVKYELKLKQ